MLLFDVIAILVSLPTLTKDISALVGANGGKSANSLAARVFRSLDSKMDHLLAPASYLAVSYLLARTSYAAITAPEWSLWLRVGLVVSCVGFAIATFLPILWIYNALGWIFWRNPPLYIDKHTYFPASARFEDPETWKLLRKELDEVLSSQPGTRRFLDVFGSVAFIQPASNGVANGSGNGNGNNGGAADVAAKGERGVGKRRASPANKGASADSTASNANSTTANNGANDDPNDSEAAAEGWKTLFLRFGGQDHKVNQSRMPVLSSLLAEMPEVYNAFFSILQPGVSLAPHRGYCKAFIRYHLGMCVPEPERATLIVGGQRYRWHEGEGVLFDDMYVHAVENSCTKPRIVLFLDVRRPMGWLGRLASDVIEFAVDNHPYHVKVRDRI